MASKLFGLKTKKNYIHHVAVFIVLFYIITPYSLQYKNCISNIIKRCFG
jgi:hypothetical protein